MSQPQERSWWRRNWVWVIPVGCLIPLVVCGGGITLVAALIFGALKHSEPYKEAVARAQASAAVRAELGDPIQEGFFVTGNISIHIVNGEESGKADLSIPLSGPKGSATIRVVAEKSAGKWTYSTLQVLTGQERPIDLLAGN